LLLLLIRDILFYARYCVALCSLPQISPEEKEFCPQNKNTIKETETTIGIIMRKKNKLHVTKIVHRHQLAHDSTAETNSQTN
jgi:hypothetical protein